MMMAQELHIQSHEAGRKRADRYLTNFSSFYLRSVLEQKQQQNGNTPQGLTIVTKEAFRELRCLKLWGSLLREALEPLFLKTIK